MTAPAVLVAPRAGGLGPCHDEEILTRLGKARGQLAGITSMCKASRSCVDILDQLAAVRAAVDAVGLMVLQDHVDACLRDAIDPGVGEQNAAELVVAIRRYLRTR